jgi:hypothetical protein
MSLNLRSYSRCLSCLPVEPRRCPLRRRHPSGHQPVNCQLVPTLHIATRLASSSLTLDLRLVVGFFTGAFFARVAAAFFTGLLLAGASPKSIASSSLETTACQTVSHVVSILLIAMGLTTTSLALDVRLGACFFTGFSSGACSPSSNSSSPLGSAAYQTVSSFRSFRSQCDETYRLALASSLAFSIAFGSGFGLSRGSFSHRLARLVDGHVVIVTTTLTISEQGESIP